MKKNKLKLLDDFIQNEYLKKTPHLNESNKYDMELSASALNIKFLKDINKLAPFGNLNFSPIFLIKNVKNGNNILLTFHFEVYAVPLHSMLDPFSSRLQLGFELMFSQRMPHSLPRYLLLARHT